MSHQNERGVALISAIVLAVLYFALMELLLLDSQRELWAARKFRSKIVASTLAENGAELAALQFVSAARTMNEVSAEDDMGFITGRLLKTAGGQFQIDGEGRTKGVDVSSVKVHVYGRVVDEHVVKIQYTVHE